MRRLIHLTALGTALLVSLSLQAQRGGMGGGRGFGGGHAGSGFRSSAPAGGRSFASAPRGFASAPRGFAGGPRGFAPAGPRVFAPPARSFAPRTFAPRTSAPRAFAPRTFAPRTVSSSRFGVHTFAPARRSFVSFPGHSAGFNHFGHFHNHFFFHNRFFFPGCFGCVSPFFFGGGFFFGDPFFNGFYPSYPGYYAYPPPPPYAYAPQEQPVVASSGDNSGNTELAMEVQRLSDEVDDLRSQQSRQAAPPNSSISVSEPVATVSFIFRDGRKITARNYAIAGQTLWILDEHAARKFELADLDKDATQQANAANGIDIRFPAVPDKQ